MAKIDEQIIPLKYGDVPTLPQLSQIEAQEIPLTYQQIDPFKPPTPEKVIIPTEYAEPSNKISQKPTLVEQGKSPVNTGNNSQVKDGIALILLMAVAIVALGAAFKIIGGINVASVLALSIAIPILALAFAKVSEFKELTQKRAIELVGVMVALSAAVLASSLILSMVVPIGLAQIASAIGIALMFAAIGFSLESIINTVKGLGGDVMKNVFILPILLPTLSLAITLSSYILTAVAPVGLVQIFTAIGIALMFAAISYGIKPLIDGVSQLGANSLKALVLMPLVLTALSLSILLSSYILGGVRPVGIIQLFTAIAIAGMFTVISYGLKGILNGLSALGPRSLLALPFLPLVMVAVSLSIALSSLVLGMVRPVGLIQLFTAIMIAGVFSVIGFGLGKLLSGMKEAKDPATAAAIAAAFPVLMVAISLAIMLSSFILSKVKPIGLPQFLTALAISVIFIPMAFALKIMSKAIQGISVAKIVSLPIIVVAMSLAIQLSSEILAKTVPIPFATLLSIGALAILLGVTTLVLGFVFKLLGNVSVQTYAKGGLAMIMIAGVIMASSLILAKGQYNIYPSMEWIKGAGIALTAFSLLAAGISLAIQATGGTMFLGILALPVIALGIVATAAILNKGKFNNYPSMDWTKSVGMSILVFGTFMALLGVAIASTLGLGLAALAAATGGLVIIADGMVKTAEILNKGKFTGGPTKQWSEGVAIALGAFMPVYSMMMKNKIFSLFGGGIGPKEFSQAIITVTTAIVDAAEILKNGTFTGGPKKEWSEGVAIAIGGFSKVYNMLLANGIARFFGGGGIGPEDFSKAIITISTAIVESSFILKKGTYAGAPTKAWSEGVAIGIAGFSRVYNMLLANGIARLFGGGGIGPNDFSKAIITISNAIVESSFILKKGTYEGAPTKAWSEGVAVGIAGFSKVYNMLLANGIARLFGGGGMGPDDFSAAIVTISNAIVESSFILKKGTYEGAPTKAWSEGVAIGIGGFSQVYSMLLKNSIASMFGGGGIGPDDFAKSIVTISNGLLASSEILGKGKFIGGPTKEWAEAAAIGISGFSQVYSMLLKNSIASMFGGGGIGPEDFAKAIVSVSTGLLAASDILGTGKFIGGPTQEWSEGAAMGIGGFSQVYNMLVKNSLMSMFGGGGISPQDFAKSIEVVSQGLLTSSEILGRGKFVGGPTKEWSLGAAYGIGGFSQVYSMLMKNSIMSMFGGGGIGAEDFGKAIGAVSHGLLVASNNLSQGKFTGGPTKEWSEGVALGLGGFSQVYSMLMKNSIMKMFGGGGIGAEDFGKAIESISGGLLIASNKLSEGKFTGGPTKAWSEGVALGLGAFSSVYSMMQKNSFFSLFGSGLSTKDFSKSIEVISQGIVKSDQILSKGTYGNAPKKEWAESVAITLGAFSKIYDYFSGGFLSNFLSGKKSPKEFSKTIETVADGINTAASKLKGPWVEGPKKEWAQGISIAFGEFSKIYDYLSNNLLTKIFGGAIDPTQFVRTIDLITEGINTAAGKLKGPFPQGPTEDWAKGMALAFGEFSKIYDYMSPRGISSFFKSAIDPNIFVNAIQTIAGGINTAAMSISGPFPQGPTEDWAKGMSLAFGQFSKIYDYMSPRGISSWFKSQIDPDLFVNVIKTIAMGINTAAGLISGPFPQGPTEEWAKGMSLAFGAFTKIYDYMSPRGISSWFKSQIDPDLFVNVIDTIARGINTAAGVIKGPFPEGPNEDWAKGIATAFGAYSKIYDYFGSAWTSFDIDPDDFCSVIETIARGINTTAAIIKGPFPEGPKPEWADGIARAFGAFSKIYNYFGNSWFSLDIDPKKFVSVIETVAIGINTASKRIKGPFPEGPKPEWADGIARSFGAFSKIYNYFGNSWFSLDIDPKKFVSVIDTVAIGINTASKRIKGPFPEGPSPKWADGIARSFGAFSKIYNYFGNSWFSLDIDPKKFVKVIDTVAIGINTASKRIKGPFPEGPSPKWANGIARSFGAFSKIYNYFGNSWFSLDIDPKKFVSVIDTVAIGINTASKRIKGPFPEGPSPKWADGIARSFGAFSKIYNYFGNSWFSADIDPVKFSNVIDTVAIGIDTASKRIKGPFPEGPKPDWADGIAKSFGAYSQIYEKINGSWWSKPIDPDAFNTTIGLIIDGMNSSANKIKGPYPIGPTKDWAEGVAIAFGAFSNIYDYMDGGWFTDPIDPQSFKDAIETISSGILLSAKTLGGPYPMGPKKEWAESVSLAFGAFAPIYEIMAKNTGLFKSGISVEDYKNAISTIATGIVEAAKTLGSSEAQVAYKSGPSKTWSEGVSLALQGFTGIFQALNADSSWFSGSKNYDFYGKAIEAIGRGLVEAAKLLGDSTVSYDVNKIPKKEWSEAIKTTFNNFLPVLQYISKSEGIFSSGSDKLIENMSAVGQAIKSIASELEGGNFATTIIPEGWSKSINTTASGFISIWTQINNTKIGDWDSLESLSKSIVENSKLLVDGRYDYSIPETWIKTIKFTLLDFVSILNLTNKIKDDSYNQIRNITNNLVWVSKILPRGDYRFTVPETWTKPTKLLFFDFISVFEMTGGIKKDSYNHIRNIVNNITWTSKMLPRGDYRFIVPQTWIKATKLTFYDFIRLLQATKNIAVEDFNNLRNMTNNLVWVSRVLARGLFTYSIPEIWGSSIKNTFEKFRNILNSVLGINETSYNMLRNLTNNIVWVSRVIARGSYNMVIGDAWLNQLRSAFFKFISIGSVAGNFTQKQEIGLRRLSYAIQSSSVILKRGTYNFKIPKEFNESVIGTYKSFTEILVKMKASGLTSILNQELVDKSSFISKMIAEVAKFFNSANIKFDEKKMPSLEWASGFANTVSSIIPGIDLIDQLSKDGKINGEEKFNKSAISIAKAVVDISNEFNNLKLKPNTKIPENYFTNISKAISSYIELSSSLNTSLLSKNDKEYLKSLDKLETAYEKLGKVLIKLNDSLKGIDTKKMEAINSLSQSVSVLSTVDTTAFENTVDSLNKKSGTLTQAVSNVANSTPVVNKSEKETPTMNFQPKSKSREASGDADRLEKLESMMGTIAAALGAISSVIGAGDGTVTLQTYISNKISDLKKTNTLPGSTN